MRRLSCEGNAAIKGSNGIATRACGGPPTVEGLDLLYDDTAEAPNILLLGDNMAFRAFTLKRTIEFRVGARADEVTGLRGCEDVKQQGMKPFCSGRERATIGFWLERSATGVGWGREG